MGTGYFLRIKILGALLLLMSCAESSVSGDEVFLYDSHGKRDPFVPLAGPGVRYVSSGLEGMEAAPQPGGGEFVLSGIVWDPDGESFAVINGEVYKEKDEAGNYTVTAISEYSVELSDKEGKVKTLTLYREGEEDVHDKE